MIPWQTLVVAAALSWQACIYYDPHDKCGPHMIFSKDAHLCLCDAQSVAVAGRCEPCTQGRVPTGTKCLCPAGTRENETGECQGVLGLGDVCDAKRPCQHPVYSHCATTADESAGVCTNPCSSDMDCDEAYTCANWKTTPHCKLFQGVGTTCSMAGAADPICSGDGDYCFMGQCFVRGCTVSNDHATDDCPKDRKCCDVSFLAVDGVKTACVLLSSTVCP